MDIFEMYRNGAPPEEIWAESRRQAREFGRKNDSLMAAMCECGYQEIFSRHAFLAGKVNISKICPDCGQLLKEGK